MCRNYKEIAGKFVGSVLLVYGFSEFVLKQVERVEYITYSGAAGTINAINDVSHTIGIPQPESMLLQMAFMVIGLTLITIGYNDEIKRK